jgi:hypothetical protein
VEATKVIGEHGPSILAFSKAYSMKMAASDGYEATSQQTTEPTGDTRVVVPRREPHPPSKRSRLAKKQIPMHAPMVQDTSQVKLSMQVDSARSREMAKEVLEWAFDYDSGVRRTAHVMDEHMRGIYEKQRIAVLAKMDWRGLRTKLNVLKDFVAYADEKVLGTNVVHNM